MARGRPDGSPAGLRCENPKGRDTLQLAEGKDAVAEIATRQLLEQAKSTQQGKAELALAATKELAKEIQALKEHVLKATNSTITSTNSTRPTRKKTYAKATNTSLLGKSMHAVPPQQEQQNYGRRTYRSLPSPQTSTTRPAGRRDLYLYRQPSCAEKIAENLPYRRPKDLLRDNRAMQATRKTQQSLYILGARTQRSKAMSMQIG